MSSPLYPDGQEPSTPLDLAVAALMKPPVVVGSVASIQRVAEVMTAADGSAAVVVADEQVVGIVTDADLRSRHLATGANKRPVADVATGQVRTLRPDQTVGEALGLMASRGIHHIPVVEDGRPVGMIDAAAVLASLAGEPLQVLASASCATDVAELAVAYEQLPSVARRLMGAGTGGLAAVRVLSLFTEQAIGRIIELVTSEIGPPPAPYAMVALGSLARREQTLVTDQDHALVIQDGAADDPWYAAFGEQVTDGLAQVGFPRCPGDVMISNSAWRNDESGWRHRWEEFLVEPEPDHILASNIVLDARTVAGDHTLAEPFLTVSRRVAAGNTGSYLLFLANSARQYAPPLGLFNRWKVERRGPHAGTFDVKAGAILPIVCLARVHGIAAGSTAMGTIDRLHDAAEAGSLSRDTADILANGYDLVTTIRLLEQTERSTSGRQLDNWLRPDDLSAWQRAGLREVCKTIKVAQEAIALSYLGAYV